MQDHAEHQGIFGSRQDSEAANKAESAIISDFEANEQLFWVFRPDSPWTGVSDADGLSDIVKDGNGVR